MINVAICDDEEYMQKTLAQTVGEYLSSRDIPEKITTFSSGKTLLESAEKYDMIFLDIQMADLNGMQTARILRERGYTGRLIFITVLKEYVFDSFDVEACDYLLKPLDQERFVHTMNRIMASMQSVSHTLLIQKKNDCTVISVDEILYCEAMGRKIYIHTCQQQVISYYEKMEELSKKLGRLFFRCHRSYLVNLNYVRGYGEGLVRLSTGERLPVSRLREQEFSQTILNYLKGDERG